MGLNYRAEYFYQLVSSREFGEDDVRNKKRAATSPKVASRCQRSVSTVEQVVD